MKLKIADMVFAPPTKQWENENDKKLYSQAWSQKGSLIGMA